MFEHYSDRVKSAIDTIFGNNTVMTARIGRQTPKPAPAIVSPCDVGQAKGTNARFGNFVQTATEENRQDIAFSGHVPKPQNGPKSSL